jgi:tRNA(fMet)-specific endonuclease VapC
MTMHIEEDRIKPDLIVDTDIFSYWFKGDIRGEAYLPYAFDKQLALSFITVGELYYWSLSHSWGPTRVNILKQKLSEYVIISSSDLICWKFAEARLPAVKGGHHQSISYDDYWIAACALKNDCPILTNNYSHFSRIKGLKLLGPYSN